MIVTSDYFTVPAELKARDQWVVWLYETREGKQTKVPYFDRTHSKRVRASSTESYTWVGYSEAYTTLTDGLAGTPLPLARGGGRAVRYDGLGYVLSAQDSYAVVDLDGCRDAATGEITPEAWERVRLLDSYTEISPSGTGLHVWVKGMLPPGGRVNRRLHVEMYDSARFITMTGQHLAGTPVTINERQHALDTLHAQVFGTTSAPTSTPCTPTPRSILTLTLSDQEVLDKAMSARNGATVSALYMGNSAGYPSASEADYALISDFAFYTQDADQLERLLRTSGLSRPEKWDKRNGQYPSTLRRDIETLLERDRAAGRETYTPGRNGAPPAVAQSPESQDTYARNARYAENGSGTQGNSAFSAFSEYPPDAFPEPDPAMYYGTAGDIVGGIAPHTEASPVALLVQLLVCVGNAAGRHVYYLAEADRHYANLYAVMVGDTAKARKGTSWGHIARVCREADPGWETQHIVGGLSSGEGIIHALRNVADADLPAGDAGELLRDKRLLAREGEFASVLAQKARDGNILSMVLRDGWDGGTLGALTKNSPERATNTHLSVIGHITQAELVKCLTNVDAQNGYANRFLFVATKRAQLLPHGGDLDAIADATAQPIRALRTALEWAKTPRKIAHDRDAFALWEQEYERLSTGQPGLFGAVTARAEAQVTRLALIYAILDCSHAITAEHLRAALALWKFCEDSARYIFGDRLGEAVADRILEELRRAPNGLTRTEIYALFEHNVTSAKIDAALTSLKAAGLAVMTKEPTGDKGRPPERWRAAKPTQETH